MKLEDPEIIAEGVPPDAAIEFWKQRAKLTDDEAKALGEEAKHRAFYVTGLAKQDLVQLVSDGLAEALKNGETLEDFKKRIADAIQKQGWHDYRVENIFRTNMQTAYAAGRYKKMQAVKKSRPYWQYIAIMDKRVRPSHAILHGKVYHADHEFWASNYPPNGFRCRCTVRTLSERQVKKYGLTVEKDMPQPDVWTDPKTDMEYFVHFPGADKGFRNNPGKDWVTAGLDLKKYPDANTASYKALRGVRTVSTVSDNAELAESIKKHASPFTRDGVIQDVVFNDKEYFMATDSRGKLWISQKDFPDCSNFNAAKELKSAWNKIAAGKKLSFHEEYAIESLWHELTHNRQTPTSAGDKVSVSRRIMETVTQWVARRTYPLFLERLGGKAVHQKKILKEGYGYRLLVRNFESLRESLGIKDDAKMLQYFEDVCQRTDRQQYQKAIADYFIQNATRKVAKGRLNSALQLINQSEKIYDMILRRL